MDFPTQKYILNLFHIAAGLISIMVFIPIGKANWILLDIASKHINLSRWLLSILMFIEYFSINNEATYRSFLKPIS